MHECSSDPGTAGVAAGIHTVASAVLSSALLPTWWPPAQQEDQKIVFQQGMQPHCNH